MISPARTTLLTASLLVLLGFGAFAAPAQSEGTNTTTNADAKTAEAAVVTSQQALRSNLEIQDQLHNLLLANEKSANEAAAAVRAAEQLNQQLSEIKSTLDTRQLNELKDAQHSSQMALNAAVAFGCFGFLVLLLAAFIQWNTVNRITAVAASLRTSSAGTGDLAMLPGPDVERSTTHFLGLIERLERRIQEMESGQPHPALGEGAHTNGDSHPAVAELGAGAADVSGAVKSITVLLGKGQTLMKMDQPEDALACFNEVLELDANNTDALLKKGAALERLQRLDEAVDCYDRAIAADASITMAYLYKGGVFNRMERYREALECYEQALKAQEKTRATGVMAE
jgi:tetratricopeptide (TPR) repeat protein